MNGGVRAKADEKQGGYCVCDAIA
ncbi:MAG: hypothetical protein H6Q42_4720, partial [Deltaproteobacteria bacterium]|nr:hypothetical protein [Deltaproteobacteria bacterium]